MHYQRTKIPPQRRFRMPLPLMGLLVLLAVVGIVVLLVRSTPTSRGEIGRPVRLGVSTSQKVTTFGNNIVYYDGTNLKCVNSGGSSRWSYQVGANAGFHAGATRLVAWSANQVTVLNQKGESTYIDRMSNEVQFARAGTGYVAIFSGTHDTGLVYVINADGQSVDTITVENQTLLDIGFFSVTLSGTPTEMMWVLGIDTTGTVISTVLSTYQPGKKATGPTALGEQTAYRVYYHDDLLRVVDTRKIATYDYNVKASATVSDVLIYGWHFQDVRTIKKDTYQLLVPAPELDGTLTATNLRLMVGATDRVLHLPAECMSAYLGTQAVYGFSGVSVYACRYGSNVFSSYTLPVQITKVLGLLPDDTLIAASGAEVYLISLPKY